MKTGRLLILAIVLSILANTTVSLDARVWTDAATGRTLEGEFLSTDGEKVAIKRADGKTFNLPISRLSEADKTFIKSQSPTKPSPSPSSPVATGSVAGGGPLVKLTPPVTAKGLPIAGEGKERKSGIEITNNGDRVIKGLVVEMHFLKADGSVGKSVPHTQSGFYGQPDDVLKKGKTHTIDVNSFFMKDDTAGIGGMVSEITYDDDSSWPAFPDETPARNGEDPVSAVMVGVIGEGENAAPAVACYNHGAKDLKSVSYRIEYLDAKGETLDTTSYGYAGGDDPILPSAKGKVITGGDGPPGGTADAKVKVTRLTFSDDTKWEAPK